ncbi:hypothetical protein D3C80_1440680 [compost metagenome]
MLVNETISTGRTTLQTTSKSVNLYPLELNELSDRKFMRNWILEDVGKTIAGIVDPGEEPKFPVHPFPAPYGLIQFAPLSKE